MTHTSQTLESSPYFLDFQRWKLRPSWFGGKVRSRPLVQLMQGANDISPWGRTSEPAGPNSESACFLDEETEA